MSKLPRPSDQLVAEVEALANTRGVMHWASILGIIARMREAEEMVPKFRQLHAAARERIAELERKTDSVNWSMREQYLDRMAELEMKLKAMKAGRAEAAKEYIALYASAQEKCDGLADALADAEGELDRFKTEHGEALRYVTDLATYAWRKNWSEESPEWQPLPDLLGVLSQLDNMLANMTRNARVARLEKALRDVIRVADRRTDEFDRAKAALGETP